MAASTAAWEVLIDWGDTGDFSGTYDDVTADIVGGLHTRDGFGAAYDRTPRVGDADMTLNNSENNQHGIKGLYSPANSGGPLYGQLLGYKRVKIQATFGATLYPIWAGYTASVTPGEFRKVRVLCIGAYDTYRQSGIAIAPQIDIAVDDLLRLLVINGPAPWALSRNAELGLAELGTAVMPDVDSVMDFDAAKFVAEYAGDTWQAGRTMIADAFQQAATSEWGRLWIDQSGVLHFWNREHEITDRTSQFTLDSEMTGLTFKSGISTVVNRCRVVVQPRTVGPANTVVGTNSDKIRIPPGQSKTITVRFTDNNNGADIGVLDAVTPVAGVDFFPTSRRRGKGYDMSPFIDCSMVLKGGEAELTFTHIGNKRVKVAHGNVRATINTVQIRGRPLYRYDSVEAVAQDEASYLQYFWRDKRITLPLANDADFAQELADQQVYQFKAEQAIITQVRLVNASATLYAAMLGLGVMDLITITEPDSGITAQQYRIYSVEHTVAGADHETVWGVEPRLYNDQVAIADTVGFAELGSNAYLAPF